MKSLYYAADDVEPIEKSKKELKELLHLIEGGRAHLVKIDAYTDVDRDEETCVVLSRRRILYVLEYLVAIGESIEKNPYGPKRTEIDFEVFNWNRVDVYYEHEKELYFAKIENVKTDEHNTSNNPSGRSKKRRLVVPEEHRIVKGVPVVLAIEFIGGTTEIKRESDKYLLHLYRTLEKNKNLHVLIRGHVCCANKPFKARKRARIVYKYLVNSGIDKDRLSFKGYSNREPLVWPERTSADRQKNRRVDLIFSYPEKEKVDLNQ
jgi:outer membrane protein OmpA-like peptidoglycan-associated protein